MSEIRRLLEKDIEDFTWIATNAYCGFGDLDKLSDSHREFFTFLNGLEGDNLFGLFRDEKLLGGMRLTDFNMNLLSTKAKVGGIGCVAVDLVHKKEKVAKELIEFACGYFREKGMSMVTLYPFRADFYKDMGFGYGVELRQYKIEPKYFPKGASKEHLLWLEEDDREAIVACYHRFFKKHHGMMEKTEACKNRLFRKNKRIICYKKGNDILGYISFSFKKKHLLKNDMIIHEFIYENQEVLLELCTFLHAQADQFDRIIMNTSDEYFHYLVNNPNNGEYNAFDSIKNEYSVTAIGLMCRVLDVEKLFEVLSGHNFNHQSCTLKLTIRDDFFSANDGSIIVDFNDGIAHICKDKNASVEIELKNSDFSSMIMGAVSFKALVKYGLAKITDEAYMDTVNKLFITEEKPTCTTEF